MAVVEVELSVKIDGQLLPTFPYRKRITVAEVQMLSTLKTGNDGVGVFIAVPGADVIPAVQAFMIASDKAINLRINNAGAIPLNDGGILILIDGNVNAGAASNLQVNNPAAPTATLSGFTAGT